MGAIAIDVNDMVGVNAAAFRVLSDNLGDDVTRAFINQFKRGSVRKVAADRPRVSASRIAAILERSRAEAEAGRGKGEGDYTKEKYNMPCDPFDVIAARVLADGGRGDYTKEKYDRPDLTPEEFDALLEDCKAESVAADVWE